MDYTIDGKNIILFQKDLDLDETLDCGQAFRWKKVASDYHCTYEGHFLDTFLTVSQCGGNKFIFHDTSEDEFIGRWADYFDLSTDYGELKRQFSEDKTLAEACSFAGGIRLLRQDAWECLISFIISQNNNIPRIKGIIDRLCENYGHFPTPAELSAETPDTLAYLRSGFRAKYLCDAAKRTAEGSIDLEVIKNMPIEDARSELKKICGVGPKVAECVLLYGMHRTEAFPIDVWIKRVLAEYYPDGFPGYLSENAGIAQQFLFHYIRSKQIQTA